MMRKYIFFAFLWAISLSLSIHRTIQTYYDDCHHCYDHGPSQPPKTVIENMVVAIAGFGMSVSGILSSTIGVSLIGQALNAFGQAQDENRLECIIDGCGGLLFNSFGVMFSLLGIQVIKESVIRIYKIIKELPLPEEDAV